VGFKKEKMNDLYWISRTNLLLGEEKVNKLFSANVLVVGMGGVGSFAAEMIARAGIGKMTIIDGDTVDSSNRNRQLPALSSTVGMSKAELMGARIRDINPEIQLKVVNEFLTPEGVDSLLETPFDYVVDCIDSITPKLHLTAKSFLKGYKLVSSMGAGAKLDPTKVRIADLSETYGCRLARYVRKRMKQDFGIQGGFPVVFSVEQTRLESVMYTPNSQYKRSAYGTISYLPAVFGCTCASVVIRDLAGEPLSGIEAPPPIKFD
jgi:tRNA A37 threonylcarbamoyladenosine dehydratase